MPKYKLSYYIIVADTPDATGKKILYSSRSGKGKIVSSLCYDFLINQRFDEIPKSTLDQFIEAKFIVPNHEDELDTVIKENENSSRGSGSMLYEVIQPSAMCQLGCYYCGQDHVRHSIQEGLYKNLIKRIEAKIEAGNYNHLFIGWFGAEPLLALPQIKELTRLFKTLTAKHGMEYSCKMVTNGVGMKPNIYKLLVEELSVTKIEVTLDGLAEYHDQHRYTKNGKGSFDIIYKNLEYAVNSKWSKRCPISIRCNVDIRNEKGVSGLIKKLSDDGLHKKIAYFYPIGIYSWGGNDAQEESLTKEEYAKKEIAWFKEKHNADYPSGSILPKRNKIVCMSVTDTADMYDAYGNVFSCSEVSYSPVYKDKYLFNGKLARPESITSERPLTTWYKDVQKGEVQCQGCKIFPVCGGACPKSWKEGIPACPSMKFNLKQRMQLSYIFNKADTGEIKNELDTFIKQLDLSQMCPV
ncbi:MAG: radical SAM protein [Bacteroidota bacterium]